MELLCTYEDYLDKDKWKALNDKIDKMIDIFGNNELCLILSKNNSQEKLKERDVLFKELNNILKNLEYTVLVYKLRDLYQNYRNGDIYYEESINLYREIEKLENKEKNGSESHLRSIDSIQNDPNFSEFLNWLSKRNKK